MAMIPLESHEQFSTVKSAYSVCRKYVEMDAQLRQLTGYTLTELVELFAAGYSLTPPEPTESLGAAFARALAKCPKKDSNK